MLIFLLLSCNAELANSIYKLPIVAWIPNAGSRLHTLFFIFVVAFVFVFFVFFVLFFFFSLLIEIIPSLNFLPVFTFVAYHFLLSESHIYSLWVVSITFAPLSWGDLPTNCQKWIKEKNNKRRKTHQILTLCFFSSPLTYANKFQI